MPKQLFLTLCLLFISFPGSLDAQAQTVPPPGIIGWWPGDGDGRDISGNGRNGMLFNNAGYAIGKVGQGFDFVPGGTTNPSHLEVPDNAALKPAQFTIEVWVKFSPTFDNYSVAIAKGFASGVNDSYALVTSPSSANPQFFTTHNGSSHLLAAPANLANPNSWNHLAASYDGMTKRLYVNGALVASVFVGQPVQYDVNPAPLTIGTDWENGAPFNLFNGFVDEPTLYNRALGDGEILAIYNAGVGGKTKSALTAAGANSQTLVNDATITFQNVSVPGTTTDFSIDPASAGSLPPGYTQANLAYDISTAAVFNGTVNLCFHIPSINDATVFGKLKILHSEGGMLVDKTTGFHFATRFVCGMVTSLSPFVIANGLSPSAADGAVGGKILDAAGNPVAGVAVRMNGTQSRLTITDAQGNYHFANVEINGFYTITPTRANYAFNPAQRSFSLVAHHNEAAFTALAGGEQSNPLDTAEYFVRQQYVDFLAREPDEAGLGYWSDQISQCGDDQLCLRRKRIDVSNAFFHELEYQQSGSYVFRLYRAAFGNDQPFPNPDSSNPAEARKLPGNTTFTQDRMRVIGGAGLAQSQLDLANAFVQRSEFAARYPASFDGPTFVDALLTTVRNDSAVDLFSQRDALIAIFNSGGRGAVMYRLADDNLSTNPINNRAFIDAEYNRAFVATQYFGYLRRDSDIGGFLFWLGQVNSGPLRDATKQRAMVCAFITSAEYQQRFSSVVAHSNAECPQ